MNKLFIIYILIFNFLIFNQINALSNDEIAEANKIANIIGLSGSDVCETFSCSSQSGSQHIDRIVINKPGDLSSINFAVFTGLQELDLGDGVYPPLNIISQISNCQFLTSLSISNLIEGSNDIFPSSLETLFFKNFKGTFYANSIGEGVTHLSIINSVNFSLNGNFSVITTLSSLDFPLPSSGFQDLTICFPNMVALTIYMKEVSYSGSGYVPSSYLGSIENYGSSFSSLIFSFDSNSTTTSLKKRIYLPDFRNLELYYFSIIGDPFVLAENQILDFSNTDGLEINIEKSTTLFKNHSNCLKLGRDSTCIFKELNMYVDQFDLRNCSMVTLSKIVPKQEMLFLNFNFEILGSLRITESLVYGDLPESLCGIIYSVIIQNNLFSTQVPSCYICNQRYREYLLPNNFTDFNLTYPSNSTCPFTCDFLDLYHVDTQNGFITVTCNNLGYSIGVTGDYGYEVVKVNQVLKIFTAPGTGTTTKQITLSLYDREQVFNLIYNYAEPIIYGYSISKSSVTVYCKYLDYGPNKRNTYYLYNAYDIMEVQKLGDFGYFEVSPPLNYATTYTSYIQVEDQFSAVFPVYYDISQISITDTISFTTNGVILTVSGNFGVTEINKVKLYIGDILCTVSEINSTSLTFTYPKSKLNIGSDILLVLIVNNVFYHSTVEIKYEDTYIPYIPPPMPEPNTDSSSSSVSSSSSDSLSSSSSDSLSSSSSPSSSSSSDDHVSSSHKLNPFDLILIISIISIIIL